MNPWQAERLAATYAEERRREAEARTQVARWTRQRLPRAAAAMAGMLLVRIGRRLLEIGGATQGSPNPRRASVW